jgi:diguanylate cyclase (GGDEF)-like protein/PAS domain S-box-containing protein
MSNLAQDDETSKTPADLLAELAALRRRVTDLEAAVSQRQETMEVLSQSERQHRILLDESSDPIFMFQADGQYLYVNRAFADGVGRPLAEITGRKIWDVFPKDEADKRFAVVRWVFENRETKVIEVRVPRPDGDRFYITTAKPVFDEAGAVKWVICISKEITDRKRMEQELQYFSSHDALTGLFNRNYFDAEWGRLQISRLYPMGIVVADVDNLKRVNDRCGHSVGDQLIQKAARVLRQSFRVEDIIARLGGDEFIVLLPKTDEAATQAAVARLRAHLAEESEPGRLGLSIGLAVGHEGSSLVEVIRAADLAMYQDKLSRKHLEAGETQEPRDWTPPPHVPDREEG